MSPEIEQSLINKIHMAIIRENTIITIIYHYSIKVKLMKYLKSLQTQKILKLKIAKFQIIVTMKNNNFKTLILKKKCLKNVNLTIKNFN